AGPGARVSLGDRFGRFANGMRDAILPDGRDRGWASERPSGSRWLEFAGRALPRLALFVAVALLISAIALFAFRAAYADKVYPAVAVGDVPVGGMTVDQAVAAVEDRAAELES